jgi:hypothetical protein
MLKAWHTHGNTPHGGADFYPLLAEVGNGLIATHWALLRDKVLPPLGPAYRVHLAQVLIPRVQQVGQRCASYFFSAPLTL